MMRKSFKPDPVDAVANLVAAMALRECTFLDELWIKRVSRTCDAQIKRRHKQFMAELTAYYSCICEHFLEIHSYQPAERFMDLVADEVARAATHDRFIAKPPYFSSDMPEHRRKRYGNRIGQVRSKLRFMPRHLAVEWMAARTALALREIISDTSDDPNELSRIEQSLAERLEWTAMELTG